MKTIHPFALGVVALLGLSWGGTAHADPPRTTGKVLLLDNFRTLEGDIQRQGERYVIRRGTGEMTLPAGRALRLCATWEEAFAFMQSQANLRDPDERLRLARWCEANGQRALALAEVTHALHLRPGHLPSQELLKKLQQAPSAVQSGGPAAKAGADAALPAVDLSAECLALFNTRIQPLLMNACAACHAGGRGGDFKLAHCVDATVNRRATQINLAAVLAQIKFEQPETSPLLYKSFSKHGPTAQAHLQGRQSAPYQMLQEWVLMTVRDNPHLRKEVSAKGPPVAVAPVSVSAPPVPVAAPVTPVAAPPVVNPGQTFAVALNQPPAAPVQGATVVRPVEHQAQTLPPPQVQTQAAPPPNDPFSPVVFNRENHPNR